MMLRLPFLLLIAFAAFAGEAENKSGNSGQESTRILSTISIASFKNLSPVLEADWSTAAIDDLLTSAVSRTRWLMVLERTATTELRTENLLGDKPTTPGKTPQPAGMPRSEAAGLVLGGSFLSDGSKIQIEAQVSNAASGAVLWSKKYDADLESLPRMCSSIAMDAVTAISASIKGAPPAEQSTAASEGLPLTTLVALYRGKHALERSDAPAAVAEFMRVVRSMPDYGDGWLQLGQALDSMGRFEAAVQAYERAIAVDPDDPAVAATLWRLARAAEDRGDRNKAEILYRRLIAEYPYSGVPMHQSGYKVVKPYAHLARQRLLNVLIDRGQWDEARGFLDEMRDNWLEGGLAQQAEQRMLRLAPSAADVLDGLQLSEGRNATISLTGDRTRQINLLPQPGWRMEKLDLSIKLPQGVGVGDLMGTFSEINGVDCGDVDVPPKGNINNFAVRSDDLQTATSSCTIFRHQAEGCTLTLTYPATLRGAVLNISPMLKRLEPCAVRVVTAPANSGVSVDGHLRKQSPCRIGDLKPGKHVIQAVGNNVEVTLVEGKEPQIELFMQQQSTDKDWSRLVPAVVRNPAAQIGQIALTWHKSAGWALSYGEDDDIFVVTSKDGIKWTSPRRLPGISTLESETLETMLTAPSTGRTALVFCRNRSVYISCSDDLAAWTTPQVLASPRVDPTSNTPTPPVRVVNATVSASGKFALVLQHSSRGFYATATSVDGIEWKVSSGSIPGERMGELCAARDGSWEYYSLEPVRNQARQTTVRPVTQPDGRVEWRPITSSEWAVYTSQDAVAWEKSRTLSVSVGELHFSRNPFTGELSAYGSGQLGTYADESKEPIITRPPGGIFAWAPDKKLTASVLSNTIWVSLSPSTAIPDDIIPQPVIASSPTRQDGQETPLPENPTPESGGASSSAMLMVAAVIAALSGIVVFALRRCRGGEQQ